MTAYLERKPPLYAVVAHRILAGIADGTYAVGSLLPPEHQLCASFAVSRITIRAAMQELEGLGIISRQAGIGTRVLRQSPAERFVHVSNSVDDVLQLTESLTFCQTGAARIEADAALAERLGVARGKALLRIEGIRVASSGMKVFMSTHFIPVAFAPRSDKANRMKGSLAAALAARHGVEIETIEHTITAVALGRSEAQLLGVRMGAVALQTWRRYFITDGRLLIASSLVAPADRYSYSTRSRRARVAALTLKPGGKHP